MASHAGLFLNDFREPLLALTQSGLRLPLGQGDGDLVCGAFHEVKEFGSETTFGAVVQLQQAEGFIAAAQAKQGHGFVAFAVAPIARPRLAVLLGGASQQFGGAVGPEAAFGCEERQSGVESPAQYVAAHALKNWIPRGVPEQLAGRVAATQAAFGLNKLLCEAPRLEIRKIIPFLQPHAHRLATRSFLKEGGDVSYHLVRIVLFVEQLQKSQPGFAFVEAASTLRLILEDQHDASDGPTFIANRSAAVGDGALAPVFGNEQSVVGKAHDSALRAARARRDLRPWHAFPR